MFIFLDIEKTTVQPYHRFFTQRVSKVKKSTIRKIIQYIYVHHLISRYGDRFAYPLKSIPVCYIVRCLRFLMSVLSFRQLEGT